MNENEIDKEYEKFVKDYALSHDIPQAKINSLIKSERLYKKYVKQKYKKHTEFSKLIFCFSYAAMAIVMVFSMFLMWHTLDTSPLSYLITSVAGFCTASSSFYYWKAKAENKIKLERKYGVTVNTNISNNDVINNDVINNDLNAEG